jgi:hypothetical protein
MDYRKAYNYFDATAGMTTKFIDNDKSQSIDKIR